MTSHCFSPPFLLPFALSLMVIINLTISAIYCSCVTRRGLTKQVRPQQSVAREGRKEKMFALENGERKAKSAARRSLTKLLMRNIRAEFVRQNPMVCDSSERGMDQTSGARCLFLSLPILSFRFRDKRRRDKNKFRDTMGIYAANVHESRLAKVALTRKYDWRSFEAFS
jgi:hypothetical protein